MNKKLRAVYVLSIGWWLGPLWFMTGLMLCLTIIGIPLGYKMIDSTYTMTTGKFE